MVGLFYKENRVLADIVYSNGDVETVRIIPQMAANGFFLDTKLADLGNLAERVAGPARQDAYADL